MKLNDMREILRHRDIQLTKSLGQNFLHDQNQVRKIVDAAMLSKDDKVLEIGPGLGPLTELLLERAGEVLAIEHDLRLVEFLRERFPSRDNLTLIHDDAVSFLSRESRDWSDWKLVSNLPYSVASRLLVDLACGARAPKKIVATLQHEVTQRLMAQTDDDGYGVLTLLVQLDFEPQTSFKIPPASFFPEPDVDSACVVMDRRAQPLLPENLRVTYVKIVKRSLSQRRKMMMKLLKQDSPLEKLQAAFDQLKISPLERAEKVSLEQFVKLTEILAEK